MGCFEFFFRSSKGFHTKTEPEACCEWGADGSSWCFLMETGTTTKWPVLVHKHDKHVVLSLTVEVEHLARRKVCVCQLCNPFAEKYRCPA